MITREQIELIKRHYAGIAKYFPWEEVSRHYEAIAETCDLALQALDQERDAKLGAAVRAALPISDVAAYESAEPLSPDWLVSPESLLVLQTIAAHLREESKQ